MLPSWMDYLLYPEAQFHGSLVQLEMAKMLQFSEGKPVRGRQPGSQVLPTMMAVTSGEAAAGTAGGYAVS